MGARAGRSRRSGRLVGALAALLLVPLLAACPVADEPEAGREAADSEADEAAAGAFTGSAEEGGDLPRASRDQIELPVDWEIFRETVEWAWAEGVDTLPMGRTVARIGERFVGTAYEPHTLEVPGPERVVINLQAMDCVTFVENALALARFVKTASPEVLREAEGAWQGLYREILEAIRYRDGTEGGYPSRLHYFSEWIRDNAALGLVEEVTRELGGVEDPEPVDFMSTHPDAYAALAESPETVEAIRRIEARLSAEPRHYIPEDRIAAVEDRIRTGDIIAATSTVEGLDVAHTGIALRGDDGVLRLMHAPLVGKDVQISETSLAERIVRIGSQDGIMVARPLEPGAEGEG